VGLILKAPSWHEILHAGKPQRGLITQDSTRFSLGIPEEGSEDYYKVLNPDSHPLVVLSTMEDLRKRLDKAGLIAPITIK
jgi:hypothetical protein